MILVRFCQLIAGAPRVIVVLHDAVAAQEILPMQRHSNCFYISSSSSAKNIFSAGFLRIQKQNCSLVSDNWSAKWIDKTTV